MIRTRPHPSVRRGLSLMLAAGVLVTAGCSVLGQDVAPTPPVDPEPTLSAPATTTADPSEWSPVRSYNGLVLPDVLTSTGRQDKAGDLVSTTYRVDSEDTEGDIGSQLAKWVKNANVSVTWKRSTEAGVQVVRGTHRDSQLFVMQLSIVADTDAGTLVQVLERVRPWDKPTGPAQSDADDDTAPQPVS